MYQKNYAAEAKEQQFVRKPNFKKTQEERSEIRALKHVHFTTLKNAGYNPKIHLNTDEVRRQILNR